MAGLSDSPSRKIAREFGADMTMTGLISSEGLFRDCHRSRELAKFDPSERPIGLQIFGSDPEHMAKAADRLLALEPDFIDINFGCPARKVVGGNGGSSILRNLGLLGKIVEAVVKAVPIPVTVKIRSGWDSNELVHIEAGKIAEDCGAAAVTLHPRTKLQGFGGKADWSKIAELKNSVSLPVIGNGDIFDAEDAARMFRETGCDAVMIGRAAVGNPWIFGQIKNYLSTGELLPHPGCGERIDLILEHFDSLMRYYGLPGAIFKMRGQYPWYLRGLPGNNEIKSTLNRLKSPEEIRKTLLEYRDTMVNDAEFIGSGTTRPSAERNLCETQQYKIHSR